MASATLENSNAPFGLDYTDIFNTDLFSAGPSGTSPASSHSTPPPTTPPNNSNSNTLPFDLSEPSIFTTASTSASAAHGASSEFFNFLHSDPTPPALHDDFLTLAKPSAGTGHGPDDMMMSLLSGAGGGAPYDFSSILGVSDGVGGAGGIDVNMPLAVMTSNGQLPSPAGTIDPSMMGTPSTVTFDDFDVDMAATAVVPEQKKEESKLNVVPVKAAGHGKGGRKGTVASGGVTKSTSSNNNTTTSKPATKKAAKPAAAPSNASSPGSKENADDDMGDDDEIPESWRPSPEQLAKMTSKEKRQLRNKISARNFRVRRKEYITHLESDILERDKLISAIRAELGSSQSENSALRQEISSLKRALLSGRPASPSLLNSGVPAAEGEPSGFEGLNLPPPAPLPTTSAAERLAQQQQITPPTSPRSSPALARPNISKDLPSTSAGTSSAFYGGFKGGSVLGGGVTSVHRMVLPEIPMSVFNTEGEGENMNPALNVVPASNAQSTNSNAITDPSVFSMKNMDLYRMHLWQQIASQRNLSNNTSPANQAQQKAHLTGLAQHMRPHFFSTTSKGMLTPPPSPPLTNPKSLAASLPLPSSYVSSASAGVGAKDVKVPGPEHTLVATIASQTLLQRLGSAFWDAFKGDADGEKEGERVRKVLEGRAVLRVVDVEPSTMAVKERERNPVADRIKRDGMIRTAVVSPRYHSPPLASASGSVGKKDGAKKEMGVGGKKECAGCVTDMLEEGMRGLRLGK